MATTNRRVQFTPQAEVRHYHNRNTKPLIVTYNSVADGHYISERDRKKAGLTIIRKPTKQVGVANGGTSTGQHVVDLPIPTLSKHAMTDESFDDFPASLLSVGKIADDCNVYIFTPDDVEVYKEDDALITCNGKPILIRARDGRGHYCIPLIQQQGQ